MIPAALVAILAISRLGAIHTVVFGGFAPAALAQRIEASRPRVVMTASCGVEGAKGAVPYRPLVRGAVDKSGFKPGRVMVWQREEGRWSEVEAGRGERDWQELVEGARRRRVRAEAVPVKSADGLYIIYTSGECARKIFLLSVLCAGGMPSQESLEGRASPDGGSIPVSLVSTTSLDPGRFQPFALLPIYPWWSFSTASFRHFRSDE